MHMTTIIGRKPHEGTESGPVARMTDAATALRLAKERSNDAISAADAQLCRAVREANDLGISWQKIAETLGVARGNAYQRYRRKPGDCSHHCLR
jgi:hypothetical protein